MAKSISQAGNVQKFFKLTLCFFTECISIGAVVEMFRCSGSTVLGSKRLLPIIILIFRSVNKLTIRDSFIVKTTRFVRCAVPRAEAYE